jgi:phosphotransferase system HPr (HPr) family protein
LIVPNAIGLHARPAAMLTRTAQEYDAKIVLECGRRSVDAKSMMGILTLGAAQGAKVRVLAEGHDAGEAIRAIECLFVCSFHEEAAVPQAEIAETEGQTAVLAGDATEPRMRQRCRRLAVQTRGASPCASC